MSNRTNTHKHANRNESPDDTKYEKEELDRGVMAADDTGMLADERSITLQELDLPPKPKH